MISPRSDPDILVIGAGAAGLAAASRLARAHASFHVVEARDRLGGRAHTIRANGDYAIDLGCGWLHSAEENPFVNEAHARGFDIDRSDAPWQKDAHEISFPLAEQNDYRNAWDQFYQRLEQGADEAPDQAASNFLEPGCRWNALIDAGSTFINGVELDSVSTIDFSRYHDSGINWRAPAGYGALISSLGAGLPVTLDCQVIAIDHSGRNIRVETTKGTFTARAVIVTLPTNILAEDSIRFTPMLPDKIEAARRLPLGLDDKLFLAVDRAENLPIDGRLYGAKDRVGIASYHLRPFGRPLIEAYFGGRFARELEQAGERAFADFAIGEIIDALGADMRKRLSFVAVSGWARDRFARGSYSYAQVGFSDMRATLAAPVDNRLFFAGEATSRRDFSTAHGAYRTGVEAAERSLIAMRDS